MVTQTAVPHQILDLSGQRCPNLVIGVIRALHRMQTGQILQVITTDLSSPSNLAAWCRQSGHELIDLYDEHDTFVFHIKKCAG